MKILEVKHFRNSKVIWSEENILNTLHKAGEAFILSVAFAGGAIPSHYYIGLDNRATIAVSDTMSQLSNEPSINGYSRQALASSDFSIVLNEDGHYRAVSIVMAFQAITGSWGPIQNIFITNMSNNSGSLISTARFSIPVTVAAGDSVTARLAMSLRDAPI